MLAGRGDLPANEIECCIARCIRPVVVANECFAKLSCRVITAKNFSYVRPRCRQLHDPILATLGVDGADCCEQRVRLEKNRDVYQATHMENWCRLSPNIDVDETRKHGQNVTLQ